MGQPKQERKGRGRRAERVAMHAWRQAVAGPKSYGWSLRIARLLQGPAAALGLLRRWTRFRAAPRLARRTFRRQWRDR